MCLLAIQVRALPGTPVILSANREEYLDRISFAPQIQPGSPSVICGLDQRAGGTWLGVNQYGLLVAVTNRPKTNVPVSPRSRGLLCLELLRCDNALDATSMAESHLRKGEYAGANFLCADAHSALVVHAGDKLATTELSEGLHLLSSGDVNDENDSRIQLARQMFDQQPIQRAADFLKVSQQVMSYSPPGGVGQGILVREPDRGTISSTMISLGTFRSQSIYHYAAGSPDQSVYGDYSPLLHEVLSH